jgi:subtilase family serine protease
MQKLRGKSVGSFVPLLIAFLFLALTASAQTVGPHALRGHHALPAAARSLAVDRLATTQQLQFTIGLPLRNQAELGRFLQELSDPSSPNYRKFLTPEQFTEKFGPTKDDYQAVLAYARSNGFTVTATHSNRMLVSVSAPVSAVEKAFHVTMRHYKHPTEARNFFTPDTEPTLDLAVPIQDIGGLDDFVIPHANYHPRPATATPQNGSAWGGGYMGADFRRAYAPDVALTGTGQSVGTINFAGYYLSDVQHYEDSNGVPHIPVVEELLDGVTNAANNAEGECMLDLEMIASMSPGIDSMYFYRGVHIDTMLSAIAGDNVAKQIGASWTYGITGNTPGLLQQLAAEGITFFTAAGDYDAYPAPGHLTVPDCAGNPYVTCVGGTTLTMNGNGVSYASEKVWNWSGSGGTGGGISSTYSIPFWQQGIAMTANQGSTTMRNIPDVALTGDNVYVYDSTSSGTNTIVGGTSCATPLWAAFTALINQQNVNLGNPTIGAFNPLVYAIGKNPAYSAAFHDTTVGNNTNSVSVTNYPAVPGYDLCTGWGTPKGQATINAFTTMPYLASVPPATLTAYAGSNISLTVSAGGQATLAYQWFYDGTAIAGATGATLNFSSLQPTNSGRYFVVVTNNYGAVTSAVCALSVIATPPYVAQTYTMAPVACWRLNETSGTTAYDLIGGFNGTNNGSLVLGVSGPTAPAWPGFESGNTAYQFSGSGTSVSVPALNLNTNTVTITAWVNTSGTQGYYPGIFSWQGGGSSRGQFIFSNGNNKLACYWNGSLQTSTLVVPTNQWTFVALVVSPTNTVIYIATNSTLAAWTNTAANQPAAFTNTAYIGTSPYGSYTGGIDEVTVYNQSLAGSQIASLLAASQTASPAVTLTAPADGSVYVAPANISLTASVATNGHSIQKVQFYNGANLLAESTTPPYQYNFSSVPHGVYTFVAEVVYDGGSVLGSLPANITVTNQPPVAVADATNTLKNAAVTINVLANDSDPNGYALTLQSVTQPVNGTAAISGTNILYTPPTGYTGTDTFSYTIFDGYFDTATAAVTVTVIPPNPPTLVNDTATTAQNTAVTIPVLANDTDPYSLPLFIQSVTQPARGTAAIAGPNVIYTPNNYWYGLDTFTYTANDGYGLNATATVSVTTPYANYPSPFTNAVLSASPIAYWRLNETSGTTAHDNIGGYNGTNNGSLILGTNGPTAPAWPGFENGNTAYSFSGSGTSVSLPALNVGSNITLTAWVKPNADPGYYPGIISWNNGSGIIISIGFANHSPQLTYMRNGFVYSSSSQLVPTNQWSFIALVASPTNAVLYLATNAALISYNTGTVNPALVSFTNVAYLGNNPNYGRYSGAMDEAAIFNQVLTPSQISGLLAAAQTGLPAIALTAPADGSTFNNASNITLTASVTTNGYHTVEGVQFYNSATLLGQSSTTPYQFIWSGAPVGTNTLTAKLLYDGGSVLTSASANITVTNAVTVSTIPTNIVFDVSGTNLNFSWPADHIGWRLIVQTNNLANGISLNTNDWGTVSGSAVTNLITIPIDSSKPGEFYRLIYP